MTYVPTPLPLLYVGFTNYDDMIWYEFDLGWNIFLPWTLWDAKIIRTIWFTNSRKK